LEVKTFLGILRNQKSSLTTPERHLDNTPPECYNHSIAEYLAAEHRQPNASAALFMGSK
jgi:hypothetical protein